MRSAGDHRTTPRGGRISVAALALAAAMLAPPSGAADPATAASAPGVTEAVPGVTEAVPGGIAPPPDATEPTTEGALRHQGVERRWLLLRPAGTSGRAVPLVLALHGLSEADDWRRPVAWLRAWWTLDAVAGREGFAVAYPAALSGRWSYAGRRPVPLPAGGAVDDVGFLAALIDRLVAEGVADPARVFVAGASRGGLMTWTLLCALPGRIAAAAPLLTGMTDDQLADCAPPTQAPTPTPTPILALAGTDDRVQAWDGWLADGFRLLSLPETLDFWRRRHGCTGQAATVLPHRERGDPTRVRRIDWTGCAPGAALRLFRVEGGGHTLPSPAPRPRPGAWEGARNRDLDAAEEIWRFFAGAPPRR